METRPFQVDLAGIVELLSEHLYSGPQVFLRELLQNGVDAISARRAVEPAHRGGIEVVVRPASEDEAASVTVVDDGIGLTLEQATDLLATIGASSKRRDIEAARASFIGQFGVGLLSCFLVSDEIEVTTRSVTAPDAPVVRWVGRSDGTFTVSAGTTASAPAGTSVTVRARAGAEEWFDRETVVRLVTHYGELLPVPVRVESPQGRVTTTLGEPPWRWSLPPEERHEAWLAFGRERLGVEVDDVFPIAAVAGGVEGLAFVHRHPMPAGARPLHRVHLKRMLVSDHVEDLLPRWAFFVSCVVDADGLHPTASRESLREDAVLHDAREQLGLAVRGHLLGLAVADPGRLGDLVQRHERALKQLACEDDELLSIIADWLPFETTEGRRTLREFRGRHPVVRFTLTVDTFRQVAQVAAAQDIGVVNGGYVDDAEVLARAGEVVPGVRTELVEAADVVAMLAATPSDDRRFDALREAVAATLAEYGCGVSVKRFSPAALPALYTCGDEARHIRTIERTRAVADPLFGSILDAMRPEDPDVPDLCLNADNPLVERLAGVADPDLRAAAVEALYVQALLLGRHPLRPAELAVMNTSLLTLIGAAIDHGGRA
jgi:molecular chaperone HtpG